MAVNSNILDLITAGSQPALKQGDLLAPPTLPTGYIGSYHESDGTIPGGQRLFILQGIGSSTPGTADVQTVTFGAATKAGNIQLQINGLKFLVAVGATDTNAQVAAKVSALSFTTAGYNDSVSTNVVTFTATSNGVKPLIVFTDVDGTGVTGSVTHTTSGTNDTYAGGYNVYPTTFNSSYNAYVADTTKQPIIIQTSGQVVYTGGRNSKQKDVYSPDGITTVTITAGQEPKEVLKAFLLYCKEQYGFGPTDFENGKVQYIQV